MKEKIKKIIFSLFFISKNAGALVIVMALGFGIWSSIGDIWYKYFLNPILIWIAGAFIGTPFIEGLTRGFSYLYLFKITGLLKALIINIPTIIFFVIAFFIVSLVFKTPTQLILFFVMYVVLSTVVAVVDGRFLLSIERTRAIESMPHINSKKIQ